MSRWSHQITENDGTISIVYGETTIDGLSRVMAISLFHSIPKESMDALVFKIVSNKLYCHEPRSVLISLCAFELVDGWFQFLCNEHGSAGYAHDRFFGIMEWYFQQLIIEGKIEYIENKSLHVVVTGITDQYPTLCSGYSDG